MSCMKPLSFPPARSKQSTRWAQSSGSKTCARARNRRRRRGRRKPQFGWRQSTHMRQHPIGLIQRRDVDDAQHRVEDEPRIGRRRKRAPSRRRPKGTRWREIGLRARSPALNRIRRRRRRRRPCRRRLGVGWLRMRRSVASAVGSAADPRKASAMARPGKGIEGQPMAARIEEEGAVAAVARRA